MHVRYKGETKKNREKFEVLYNNNKFTVIAYKKIKKKKNI